MTNSKMLHRLFQPRYAAPAHFQRFLAMPQDCMHMSIGTALEFDEFVPGDEAIAVDANEAFAEFLFQ